jgi:two-component system, response regulator PdtaR
MTPRPKPVVLVVEDEGMVRMLAVAAFLDEGFVVLEAEHAAEALLVYGSAPRIEVLFTDVNMPGLLDGIDLAEQLKVLSPRLHVIITSALPIVRSVDHLAATFIAKPYELGGVCQAARDLLAA